MIDMDLNPGALNPGIRKTVMWLSSNGFTTTDSGDGTTNPEGLDFPHVMMVVPPENLISESIRLCELLERQGVKLQPVGLDPHEPSLQANFDPIDPVGILMMSGIDDRLLFNRAHLN